MDKKERLNKLKGLCEDLQVAVHLRKVNLDAQSLRFSCDLLLRNMIMMLEKEENGESFTKELKYITNNLLGAHAQLTSKKALDTAQKYKINII